MRALCATLAAAALCASPEARAQPVARPPDLGYGEQTTTAYGLLDPADAEVALVDERVANDPLAGIGVVSPNAQVTPADQVTVYDLNLLGLRASYGAASGVEVAASLFVSPRLFSEDAPRYDSMGDAGARWRVAGDRNLDVTVGGALGWRTATAGGEGAEAGLAISLAADLKVTDHVILGAGLVGYAPLWVAYTVDDASGCRTRDDLALGGCVSRRDVSLGAPAAGRFAAGWASATALMGQGFTFKLELGAGASVGGALGLESGLWGDVSMRAREARARETRWGWGVPNGAPLSLGAALGWSDGLLAAQLGAAVVPGRALRVEGDSGQGLIVAPMIWIARRFSL